MNIPPRLQHDKAFAKLGRLRQLVIKMAAVGQFFSMAIWLFLGLAIFILWAAFLEIEQSVRATGHVIPSAKTQIIQATDGGVLLEILVNEGESVEKNQILAILEKNRANAAYQEVKAKVTSLKATLIRTQAEINAHDPVFGTEFADYPDIITQQLGFYQQRKSALNDTLDTLNKNLDIARQELAMNTSLLETGDISRIEVMRSQRQVTELVGKIQTSKNTYLSEARKEATRVQAEISTSQFKLDEKKDILAHTELRAPVAGKVKYLRFNTLGGVLKSGDELMQITPTHSDMIIEAKINPVDIAQLSVGQTGNIKLDTFDYTTYGGLDGTLVYLSSDTLTEREENSQMNTFYRAYINVKADTLQLNPKLSVSQLKPGMTATVDIRTKNRTVLAYIIKPITRAFEGALNER